MTCNPVESYQPRYGRGIGRELRTRYSSLGNIQVLVEISLYQEELMRTSHLALIGGLLLAFMGSAALAQTAMTPKAQYAADSKAAQSRYAADKKLCEDETSSAARLQCRRDAKFEYDKALASAKAQLAAATPASATPSSKAVCPDCGKVTSVTETERKGEGSPVGLIAGGVAGALLGNQVGGGSGKSLATIAGAAGGAYAGKKVEEKMNWKQAQGWSPQPVLNR